MRSSRGAALLAVLVGICVISLIMLSILRIAGMDRRMSSNNTALLQARQAVDGGIAWACAQTYKNLQDAAGKKELPVVPVGASLAPVAMGDGPNMPSYKILGDGVKLYREGSNYCVYRFGCEGSWHGTTQNALVTVEYRFTNHYLNGAGEPVFIGRTFTDRGKLESYRPLNPASSL